MKKNSNQDYAEALYEITRGLNETQIKAVILEFTKLLMRDHKLAEAEAIITEFEKKQAEELENATIEVTTTQKINAQVKKNIQTVVGSDVVIKEKTDPKILGGIIIKTKDTILDGSIKTQLLKLKYALAK